MSALFDTVFLRRLRSFQLAARMCWLSLYYLFLVYRLYYCSHVVHCSFYLEFLPSNCLFLALLLPTLELLLCFLASSYSSSPTFFCVFHASIVGTPPLIIASFFFRYCLPVIYDNVIYLLYYSGFGISDLGFPNSYWAFVYTHVSLFISCCTSMKLSPLRAFTFSLSLDTVTRLY